MALIDIRINELFEFPSGQYRFFKEMAGKLWFADVATGKEVGIDEKVLYRQVHAGTAIRVRAASERHHQPIGSPAHDDVPPDLPSEQLNRALTLRFFTVKHDASPDVGKGRKSVNRFIADLSKDARKRGFTHTVRYEALMRAVNERGVPGFRPLHFFVSGQGKSKRQRQPPKIESLLEEVVDFYYDLRTRDYTDAYAHFFVRLGEINAERTQLGLAKFPVWKGPETIRRRIDAARCYETWARKYSEKEAYQKFGGIGPGLMATKPGQKIIIDHTKIDTYTLLDTDTSLPMGKLTLTVAIDVFSRAVVGFLLSAEPPSLYSIMTVIKRVCRNKDYVKQKYPEIEGTWDCWCLPNEIIVDNGLEFLAPSFQDAMQDIGVDITWAPIHTPQYKAIGERFFDSLNNMLLHKLRGSTKGNVADIRRIGLNPQKDAVIDWDYCDELVHQCLIEVYHREVHSTINAQPARMWRDGAARHKVRLIDDIRAIDLLIGNVDNVTLTRAGVKFRNMVFHDREAVSIALNDMARLQPKRKQSKKSYESASVPIKIKYNPADCSKIDIYVLGAERNYYATLYNRDGRFSEGISFWHAEQIYNFAKSENLAFQTDEERWRARDRLRRASERFAVTGKSANANRARRILAQQRPTLESGAVIESILDQETELPRNAISITAPAMERLDGEKAMPGVRRGGRKATQKGIKTRLANKMRQADEQADQENGAPTTRTMSASAPKRFRLKGLHND